MTNSLHESASKQEILRKICDSEIKAANTQNMNESYSIFLFYILTKTCGMS